MFVGGGEGGCLEVVEMGVLGGGGEGVLGSGGEGVLRGGESCISGSG